MAELTHIPSNIDRVFMAFIKVWKKIKRKKLFWHFPNYIGADHPGRQAIKCYSKR